jgi:hypothetical protein
LGLAPVYLVLIAQHRACACLPVFIVSAQLLLRYRKSGNVSTTVAQIRNGGSPPHA